MIRFAGRWFLAWVRATGIAALDLARTAYGLAHFNRREFVRSLVAFGYGSIPLTAGMATLTGAIVVAQTAADVGRFGARAQLGWAASYAVIWEFGPLILAILMGARVGARNAAELASLSMGGQIEGLRGIALDPFALLVAPRIAAIVVCSGLLYLVAAAMSVIFELLTAWAALGLPARVFTESLAMSLSWREVLGGLLKSLAFGLSLATISTSLGLRARGGSRAVGSAAASAVVWSAAAAMSLDFFLTSSLTRLLAR